MHVRYKQTAMYCMYVWHKFQLLLIYRYDAFPPVAVGFLSVINAFRLFLRNTMGVIFTL